MKLTNIAAYVAAKYQRINAPGKITNGHYLSYTTANGLPVKHFTRPHPNPAPF